MKWRTFTKVAKILPDDATVTQAECTAAVEAAREILLSGSNWMHLL